jgi:hypothetical protein
VLANYTVYDYEDIVSSVKSYSFRQLNLKDSLVTRFSDKLGSDIYGEVKLYERGELNWSDFSSRPVNYYEDKIINAELIYFFNKFMICAGGYRFFQQSRYNYIESERVFDTYIRTFGPFARFGFELRDNSRIEILASYDYYRYADKTPPTQNGNLLINAVWNF